MPNFPPVPNEVKHISHFLKVADEHEERNFVVSYWSRMYACQVAMKSVPGKKPPEVTALLIAIMDWLEQAKKAHADLDGITNETCAQALIEEYAIQLFKYADSQDQAENFGKNVVKAFYTAGILMDVLQQFGDLSEEIFGKRKYAKWKAAYIHNCLKNGETPLPGPPVDRNLLGESDEDDDDEEQPSNLTNVQPVNPDIPPAQPTNFNTPPAQPFMPFTPNTDDLNLPSVPQQPTVPFQPAPATPAPQPAPRYTPVTPSASNAAAANLGPGQMEKAQKYCKFAGSALNYDDVNTAIENLQKALHLLQTGEEM